MEAKHRHSHKKHRSQHSGPFIVIRDIILLAVVMNVFALFHHVIPIKMTPVSETAAYQSAMASSPAPSGLELSADATPASAETTPAPTPVPGDFSASFPTSDTGADALYSHQTDTVRIAVRQVQENSVTYFVADVWVKNIEAFHTAFAKGTYGKSIYEFPTKTAASNDAVLAVTGDYYSARKQGIVVRNGTLYRDVPGDDVCVLYNDGEMQTYLTSEFDLDAAMNRGIAQTWSFGPALLNSDGSAIADFASDLKDRHPRSAMGYYEPGHYCFVVVDGRQKGYSVGMKLRELSSRFASLGCKQAYNFVGGATAIMLWNGEVINKPYKGGRESGDIIWFA